MDFYIYENQREHFKSFKDVDHLNDSIRSYLYKYKKDLHNANTSYKELNVIGKVFKAIYTHSVKFAGVSFLSNKTIARILGICVRSVRRATKRLLELGIILKLSTKRQNGSDTTNTIVIKPLLSSIVNKLFRVKKTPCPPPLSSLESRSFKQENNLKDLNKRIETLDHTFTSDYVPEQFKKLVVSTIGGDAKTIEEYWKMAKIQAFRNNRDQDKETVLKTSIHAFKQMINKLKKNKVHNPIAYFSGILQKKYDQLFFAELDEMGFQPTDNVPTWF
jgi:hypothetical protein